MGKYFGTDGIRGVFGVELDGPLAYRAGRAAALALGEEGRSARVLIGKDTRISSDVLEASLAAGLCSAGAEAVLLGVVPTPAVARLTVETGADAGVVISASHNPFEHNGIKFFSGQGYKLNDQLEATVEALIDAEEELPTIRGEQVGRICHEEREAAQRYVDYLCGTMKGDLSGLRIAVDCANGAAYQTAPRLFSRLGASAEIMFDRPTGININAGCGSTHLDALKKRVTEGGFDIGVAFDGDADRCLLVDERGETIDGDRIMGVCADWMKQQGCLNGGAIVATVLSNLGLHAFAGERGMRVETCQVGDRFVIERMRAGGFDLGGEQSGHVIFGRYSTTGDGELTALRFLEILKASGKKASELAGKVPQYPQVMINCPVPRAARDRLAADEAVKEAVCAASKAFGRDGRVLVRPSGTEALVRVMAEGREEQAVRQAAEAVAAVVCTRAEAL